MYRFIDVNEIQDEFFTSPDSFTINGVLPEAKILGYHTLNVSGREMLTSEVGEKDISHADGTIYLYNRDLPRELVVTYQLMAPTPEEFMRRFNALNAMISGEQMQIIFNDETDKYFTATKSSVELPEPGRIAVTGNYTLYCADPYKYALKRKTVEIKNGQNTIAYRGSKECPVILDLTKKSNYTQPSKNRIEVFAQNRVKDFVIDDYTGLPVNTKFYIDFENVEFKVNEQENWTYVTIDSDSITLLPGNNILNSPGLEGTMSYRERWL